MINQTRKALKTFCFSGTVVIVCLINSGCALFHEEKGLTTSGKQERIKEVGNTKYKLVWADEFNGDKLDKKIWTIREAKRANALSTSKAVSLKDGKLIVTISKKDGQYQTADISTERQIDSPDGGNKLDFLYGYFESKMKLPKGVGNNPSFWLNSKGMIQGVVDDLEKGGAEIDIIEHSALHPDEAVHTIWVNGYGTKREREQSFPQIPHLSEGWHTYGLLWEPNKYTFYIDGKKTFSTKKNISASKEHLRFSNNVHKKSKWLGDIDNNKNLPTNFEIEYVRVYQKK